MQKLPKNPPAKRTKRRVLIIGRRRRAVTVSAPQAPINLVIDAFPIHLRLAWNDVSGDEDGFRLYRRSFGDPFELIAVTLPNQTVFYDGNVEMGIIYAYYVVAFNAGGESTQSNQVSGELTVSA